MNQFIFFAMALVTAGTLTVTSPAFKKKGGIPLKHTCVGENVSPELQIGNIPKEAKSLALVMDDPDAPNGTFDHWVMWNIPVSEKIAENSGPGTQGLNGKKENKYYGPCPPKGTHHYHFKVYALDGQLSLPEKTDKAALMKAMEGHILASGELIGTFKKP
jgi:Raf kinase inhibitor-like YbhB/YbcL family protein